MSENTRTKIFELTRLMVLQLKESGKIDLSGLIALHDGEAHREVLTHTHKMLEIFVDLRKKQGEVNPDDFATGFAASAAIREAFFMAVFHWDDSEPITSTDNDIPEASLPQNVKSGRPGEVQNEQWMVTGHNVVAVKDGGGTGKSATGEGIDVMLNRSVQVISPDHPNFAQIEKEIKLTANLTHPHIPSVHSVAFNPEGKPSFIVPNIGNQTFLDMINTQHGAKSVALTNRGLHLLLKQVVLIARTIHFAHSQNPSVIHGDLKPEVVFLDKSDNLYISGWENGYRGNNPPEPKAGTGTVHYSAPELWSGKKQEIPIDGGKILNALRSKYPSIKQQIFIQKSQRGADFPEACRAAEIDFNELLLFAGFDLAAEFSRRGRLADIYSLGAILYHAATGLKPFRKTNNLEKNANQYEPPKRIRFGIKSEIVGIIHRAMESAPAARYASANVFADDLERVLGRLVDEPIKGFKQGEEPFYVTCSRQIRLHTVAFALLLALLSCFGFISTIYMIYQENVVRRQQASSLAAIQDIQQKAANSQRTEKLNAETELKKAGELAKNELAAVQKDSESKIKAEHEKTLLAERGRDDLRRSIVLKEFRTTLANKLDAVRQKPRRPLTPEQQTVIDEFARQFDFEIAFAFSERLKLKRASSKELSSYLLREELLRRTDPVGVQRVRPTLSNSEAVLLDNHTQTSRPLMATTQSASELKTRLTFLCEHDPNTLTRILDWTKKTAKRDLSTNLVHTAIEEVIERRANDITDETARTMAEYRRLMGSRFVEEMLKGRPLDEAIKDVTTESSDRYLSPYSLAQADKACISRFSKYPDDADVLKKLSQHPPSIDGTKPAISREQTGFQGITFGNKVDDSLLPTDLQKVIFTSEKENPNRGILLFRFTNGTELTIQATAEDVYLAHELVRGEYPKENRWMPGEGIRLASLQSDGAHIDYGPTSIRTLPRYRALLHPALANTDLGYAAMMSQAMPTISRGTILKESQQNLNPVLLKRLERLLESWPKSISQNRYAQAKYMITDVPIKLFPQENRIVAECDPTADLRKRDFPQSLRRSAFIELHAFPSVEPQKIESNYNLDLADEFYTQVPLLTAASHDLFRINHFAQVLAIFRWAAKNRSVEFFGIPNKPVLVINTPDFLAGPTSEDQKLLREEVLVPVVSLDGKDAITDRLARVTARISQVEDGNPWLRELIRKFPAKSLEQFDQSAANLIPSDELKLANDTIDILAKDLEPAQKTLLGLWLHLRIHKVILTRLETQK